MKCQICENTNLKKFLDLGNHPPPLKLVSDPKINDPLFPLEIYFCEECSLVQLGAAIDPNILFKEYFYTSGVSTSFKNHLFDLATTVFKKFNLTSEDLVVDIASNDGTLLDGFRQNNVKVLGVEPSNTADIALSNGINTVKDFFSKSIAEQIVNDFGNAKIITATNVFAHIDKIDSLMQGLVSLLSDDGVFVSESQYLQDIIEKLEYDTIYHEHLRYYSVKAFMI